MKIVILCAGRGSRLGSMTDCIPKAMLTINRKPVIGYILDHIYSGCSFKAEPEIGIAVGYKHQVLESYVRDFYADKKIVFVKVDHFQGPGSGPGLSLLQMRKFVAGEPFILVLGDTLCFDDWVHFLGSVSTIGVYKVDDSERFTTCDIDEKGFIKGFYDKVKNAPSNLAIIGIYYIKEAELYFEGLNKTKAVLIKDELQISNGLNYLLKNNKPIKALKAAWLDAGIKETLRSTRMYLGDFDTIYRNNTLTIIQGNRIRKYGCDESFDNLIKYYKEISKLPAHKLFDEVLYVSENDPKYFDFTYEKVVKLSRVFLDQKIDSQKAVYIIENLLSDLKKYMYDAKKENASSEDILHEYKESILSAVRGDEELKDYLAKEKLYLNGVEYLNPVKLLDELDVSTLMPASYTSIHGNLSLRNIVYNIETGSFKLIYPQVYFGNTFLYGDYTLDLAAIQQCFNGKSTLIKANNFTLNVLHEDYYDFHLDNNMLLEEVNKNFRQILQRLFNDKSLIDRVNLLEAILFLRNITESTNLKQKLAFFVTASNLMQKNHL